MTYSITQSRFQCLDRTVGRVLFLFILILSVSCTGNERSTDEPSSVERAVKQFDEKKDSLDKGYKAVVNQMDKFVDVSKIDFDALLSNVQSHDMEILPLGMFHGDEIPAGHHIRTWFGLFVDEAGSRLEKVEVEFRPSFDPVLDDDGEMTAKEVILASDGSKPVVLISGVEELSKEGPPIALTNREGVLLSLPHILEPDQDLFLGEGLDARYVIRVYGDEKTGHAVALLRKALDVNREIFTGTAELDDARMDIRWVGDLNGDLQPDLILNIASSYSYAHWVLFLSDPEAEQMIFPVAEMKYTGC